MSVVAKYRRFYVLHFNYLFSFSFKGYVQFLKDASTSNGDSDGWNLDNPQYESRVVKREPCNTAVFRVTDRESWEFKNELEYFLQHQEVSPWNKFERMA